MMTKVLDKQYKKKSSNTRIGYEGCRLIVIQDDKACWNAELR